jgi:hypothetical protein
VVNTIKLSVDFNGIVMFDPAGLRTLYGDISSGHNLLKDFSESSRGDDVLDIGAALPIMGINDGDYLVRLYVNDNPPSERTTVFSDSYFYINVTSHLFIADMAVLWDWEEYTGWNETTVPTGMYKVCVEGLVLSIDGADYPCYDVTFIQVDKPYVRDLEPRETCEIFE